MYKLFTLFFTDDTEFSFECFNSIGDVRYLKDFDGTFWLGFDYVERQHKVSFKILKIGKRQKNNNRDNLQSEAFFHVIVCSLLNIH